MINRHRIVLISVFDENGQLEKKQLKSKSSYANLKNLWLFLVWPNIGKNIYSIDPGIWWKWTTAKETPKLKGQGL